ncbi:MAG TPA: tetratricopeptide repeat protein [Planctomycetota bacterium]|nr:tetratricopeptide repeat protein [Planctomycetota bacterium]
MSFLLIIALICPLLHASEIPGSLELERARKALSDAHALGPKVQAALAVGGGEYVRLLDQQAALFDTAEQLFRDALRKNPEHPQTLAEFGLFWVQRKQLGQARELLGSALRSARVMQKKSEAEKTPLAGELRFTPEKEALIRRTLGGLMERAGDSGAALRLYNDACKLEPSNPRNRLSLAIGYCAAGQPHEAAVLLKPWSENPSGAPDQPDKAPSILALGLYTLALAKEETGYLEDALEIYRRAQKLAEQAGEAESTGVAERAGFAIARLEDAFDAAKARADERVKENEERKKRNLPPLPDERENYARAAQFCDEGIRYKDEALDDPAFRKLLAQTRAGSTDTEIIKNPMFDALLKAMMKFQEAVVLSPRMWRPYYELAQCNVMLGRFSTAKKLLDEAVVFSPNNLALLNLQAEVLLELGQWDEAHRMFSRVLALEPQSGRANFGLARACAALQNDARQCQAGLDALDRAEQLGVVEFTRKSEDGSDPSLRGQLTAALQRFERGERPAPRPVLKGTSPTRPQRREDAPDWKGTILER